MKTFIITALLILSCLYGFSGFRIIAPLRLKKRWQVCLWGGLVFCLAALPFSIMARHRIPGHFLTPFLSWFAYIVFGFITLLFPAILLRDAFLVMVQIITKLSGGLKRHRHKKVDKKPDSADPSRRLFLVNTTNAALAGSAFALTGYGIFRAVNAPDVVHVDIPMANLPASFQGFKILQISDLHISMTLKKAQVQAVVDRACREQADMIVVTGDMADGHEKDLGANALPLADLTAGFGKYFVTGNHDYYSGVAPWLLRMKRLGFTPLINEHRIIEKGNAQMVLAGVTDYRAGQMIPGHASDPVKALYGAPQSLPRIMLAHQPKSIFDVSPLGVDLLICGHTHGGQYIPWNFMVPLDQPYVHGLHCHGKTLVYVSRGTGYWGPPMRIGAPPEITILRLVA